MDSILIRANSSQYMVPSHFVYHGSAPERDDQRGRDETQDNEELYRKRSLLVECLNVSISVCAFAKK